MSEVDPLANLRDGVAYARALAAGDVDGSRTLACNVGPDLLLPAVGILLVASVRREAQRLGVDADVVWNELLRAGDDHGG